MRQRWLVIIGLSVFATATQAQVYKCRQADGSLRYSDKACPNVIETLSEARLEPNTTRAIEPADVARYQHQRRAQPRPRPRARQPGAQRALADIRRRETRYSDMPSVSERMAERRARREASRQPPDNAPSVPARVPDRIDTKTGKRYESIGGGQFIDSMGGTTIYNSTPGGLINTKNAKFLRTN